MPRHGQKPYSHKNETNRADKDRNQHIVNMTNVRELSAFIEANIDAFDHVNTSTAFRCLLQLARGSTPREVVDTALRALERHAIKIVDSLDARDIATVMHSIAKSGYYPSSESFWPAMAERLRRVAKNCNPVEISNSFWAHAKLQITPGGPMMQALERQLQAVVGQCEPQQMAKTLWSYATMGESPGAGVVVALEARLRALAGKCNPQAIANTLWAYATIGQKPGAGLVEALEGRLRAVAGECKPQDIANTLWAYATMGERPGAGVVGALEGRLRAVRERSARL